MRAHEIVHIKFPADFAASFAAAFVGIAIRDSTYFHKQKAHRGTCIGRGRRGRGVISAPCTLIGQVEAQVVPLGPQDG